MSRPAKVSQRQRRRFYEGNDVVPVMMLRADGVTFILDILDLAIEIYILVKSVLTYKQLRLGPEVSNCLQPPKIWGLG